MKLKTLLAPLLIGALAFAIAGCGSTSNQSTQTQKEIKKISKNEFEIKRKELHIKIAGGK